MEKSITTHQEMKLLINNYQVMMLLSLIHKSNRKR